MLKKITSFILAFSLIVTIGSGYQVAYASSDDYLSGQAIVVYKSDKLTSNFNARSAKKAMNLDSSIQVEDTWHFEGNSSNNTIYSKGKNKYKQPVSDVNIALIKSDKLSTEQIMHRLKDNPLVESVEPNRKIHLSSTNDTYYGHLWAHENHGQHGGQSGVSVNPQYKWDQGNTGKDKIIAIIDSGVDYTHPDLKDSMWKNTHYPTLKGKCGYDVAENDSDPMDLDGHGTHCAGIMAAQANNNLGVAGMAPHAKIMALKAMSDDGDMYTSTTINAYHYISTAIDLGENVVALNNSWGIGYYQYSIDKLTTLLGQKGVVSVFASGNDALDVTSEGAASSASFNNPYALFVNALSEDGEPALFTNYGKETDLFAPGSTILSTVAKPTYNPSIYSPSQQSQYSQQYNDFEDDSNQFAIPKETTLTSDLENSTATVKVEIVDNKFVSSKSQGKSLKLTFDNMQPNEFVSLSCPYTRKANPQKKYGARISAMVQLNNQLEPTSDEYTEVFISDVLKGRRPKTLSEAYRLDYQLYNQIAGEAHSWDHLLSSPDRHMNPQDQQREIVYSICAAKPGPQEIYIDDLGISNTDVDPSNFGKYDFYNGTSMAAPYVTGAIALLDDQGGPNVQGRPDVQGRSNVQSDSNVQGLSKDQSHPINQGGPDATDRIHQLMTHITKSPALANLCESGAYLDMRKSVNNGPSVTKVTANRENDTIEIHGFGLDGLNISVKIDQEPQPMSSQSDKVIVIKNSGWIGSTVNVQVLDGTTVLFDRDISLQNAKKPFNKNKTFLYPIHPTAQNISTTDGMNIYYGDWRNGNIYRCNSKDSTNHYLGTIDAQGLFGDNDSSGSAFSLGKQLTFTDGKLYNVVTCDSGVGVKMKLVAVDIKSGQVTDLNYVPKQLAKLKDFTMAAFNGMVLFIGGYDVNAEKTSSQVLAYVPWKKQWSEMNSLPEGRAGGQAFQVKGSKMIYTMGYSEKTKVADGSKQPVNKVIAPENLVFSQDNWTVSKAAGPFIRPIKVNNDGNYYNSFNHCAGICGDGLVYAGAPTKNLGDTFIYNVHKDQYEPTEYQLYDDLDFTKFTGMAVNDHFYGNTIDYSVNIPIRPGTVSLHAPKYTGGYISGANKPITPGNKVFVKPVAKKNFFVRSFLVNGQKMKFSGGYVRLGMNTKATATFGRRITNIAVSKTKITMKAGKSYKLKPKVSPANATYKQLTYKSSNPKYITVSSSGLIKAKSNSKGRSATITIAAKSKSKATKKVYVKVLK